MRAVAFGVGLATALGVVSVAAASLDDLDAPIATARYTAPPAVEAPPATPLPGPAQPAAPDKPALFDVALNQARARVASVAGKLTGLATNVRFPGDTAVELARFTAPVSRIAQDQNVRRGFGEMRAAGRQARLFLFAGDGGGVVTYNFTRDTGGVRAAGWTTERADQMGEQRVGLAWQAGRTRIALIGMERKFNQFGASMKDRVVAMSLSFYPGWSDHRDRRSS